MKNGDLPAMPQSVGVSACGDVRTSEYKEDLGLTKREHFAAMAMQGLAARESWPLLVVPKEAVDMADQLLKELEG